MVGDIQFGGIVFVVRIARILRKRILPSEEVDRHALDGRHINECMIRLGVGQILVRQDLGIEPLIRLEVLLLETLAIDLILLVELVLPWRGE